MSEKAGTLLFFPALPFSSDPHGLPNILAQIFYGFCREQFSLSADIKSGAVECMERMQQEVKISLNGRKEAKYSRVGTEPATFGSSVECPTIAPSGEKDFCQKLYRRNCESRFSRSRGLIWSIYELDLGTMLLQVPAKFGDD